MIYRKIVGSFRRRECTCYFCFVMEISMQYAENEVLIDIEKPIDFTKYKKDGKIYVDYGAI